MRGILFPSSNVLFDVQTRGPGRRFERGRGACRCGHHDRPATVTSMRPGRSSMRPRFRLRRSARVLMQPGRRCENGKPVPVDRDDWKRYVQGVVEAGRAAYRASQTRSQDAVSDATNSHFRRLRELPPGLPRCPDRGDALHPALMYRRGRRKAELPEAAPGFSRHTIRYLSKEDAVFRSVAILTFGCWALLTVAALGQQPAAATRPSLDYEFFKTQGAADLSAEASGPCPLHRLSRLGHAAAPAAARCREHDLDRRGVAQELRRRQARGRAGQR